jgi:hypothetical protein
MCLGAELDGTWVDGACVGCGAAGRSAARATRRCRHHAGTMASTPMASPPAKAASTTMTIGARHSNAEEPMHHGLLLVVQRKGEQGEEDEGAQQPDEDAHRRAAF